MNTLLLDAFAESTRSTFREMFGMEPEFGGARELDPSAGHGWDLTGLVGLAGQAQGVIALRLTASLADRLLDGSGIAASSAEERRQLAHGLVAELANIVAGAATSAMKGIDATIAPPVIVSGPRHSIGWPSIAPVVALPFRLPSGGFEIDLCLKA